MNIIEIGEQIRAARKQKKLSQSKLAGMLGMGRGRLSQLETGDALGIGLHTVLRVCMALKLELVVAPLRVPTWAEANKQRDEQMLKGLLESDRILRETTP